MPHKEQNIIILEMKTAEGEVTIEVWGSLTALCRHYIELPYNHLARKKYPFIWRNFTFMKVKYRVE